MNLQTVIKTELWNAVSRSYEARSHRNAILDAMHYLTNELRERINVDDDGTELVDRALGGNTPLLRINKFQTQSEKDEQKGFHQIMRGMYLGIRNPRSHEQTEDKQSTADAIILFINYLLEIISEAKEPFALEEWTKRVFDPDFVEAPRYANLLASEVPPKKRLDALISIYRDKMSGDGAKLNYIFAAMIQLLDDDELKEFISVVSDELKTIQDDQVVKMVLQIFPGKLWSRIDEAACIRIENKLMESIKLGKVWSSPPTRKNPGWLATWGVPFIQYFDEHGFYALLTILQKLEGDEEDQNYIAKFFLRSISGIVEKTPNAESRASLRDMFIGTIVKSVSGRLYSELLRNELVQAAYSFPADWQSLILDKLKPLENDDPEYYSEVRKAFNKIQK